MLLATFAALSHEIRLDIMMKLAGVSVTVEQLANEMSLDLSTVSFHLGKLRNAELLIATKEGRFQRYSLNPERCLVEDGVLSIWPDADFRVDRAVVVLFLKGGSAKAFSIDAEDELS